MNLAGRVFIITGLMFLCGFVPRGGGLPEMKTGSVVANLSSVSYTIPSDFVGMSFEQNDATRALMFTGENTHLITLLQLMGSTGHIRLGGNAQDTPNRYWGVGHTPVTQNLANDVHDFMSALGPLWTLNWGLNLKENDPATAITQAGYFINSFGIDGVSFSIGNEPSDLGVSLATFQTNWNAYYAALVAEYTGIHLSGIDIADCANLATWSSGLSQDINDLDFASCHSYSYYSANLPSLSSIVSQGNYIGFSTYVANHPKFRLEEAGLVAARPLNGVVDRLIYGNYVLNVGMNLAKIGGKGVSFHSAVSGAAGTWANDINWSIIKSSGNGDYYPTPAFYGHVLLSKMSGQQIVGNTKSGSASLNVMSTKNEFGNANILVVNNSANYPAEVSVGQSSPWIEASVIVLSPSTELGCLDQFPLLGGQHIGVNGTWNGGSSKMKFGDKITLKPCGAAFVSITK